MVLADGLIEADNQYPEFIIDCATLTGAAKVAVGNDYHSVLTMDDEFATALFQSAKAENEPFWRLPFEEFHRSQISSSFADIANIGTVPVGAGASTATAFLSYFVKITNKIGYILIALQPIVNQQVIYGRLVRQVLGYKH
ncbi:peptidase B [Rodentibacter pneumotropicus]|uniref:Peptidase B n=1 Tax=Rodentibacter pneumotropicus TaxID=758 RepID=A0A448MLJ5_9PAST|nr:peptidase B [Rodentibacter pneumotropicus]